jgi:membrane associated rhomboid family serine protease
VLSFGTDSLSSHQYWAILTGSFVHFELQHFFANMCGLYTAASTCCHIPGMNAWHVCAVTLGSSIMATLSMLMQFRLAPPPFSSSSARKTGIGASGVVSAFMALAVMGNPTKHADLIPFLPGLLTTPNWCLAALQLGGDLCGLLVALRIVRAPADFPKNVGHAAHLGGALVGVLYYITALAPRRRAVEVQTATELIDETNRQLLSTEEIASLPHSVQNTSLAS